MAPLYEPTPENVGHLIIHVDDDRQWSDSLGLIAKSIGFEMLSFIDLPSAENYVEQNGDTIRAYVLDIGIHPSENDDSSYQFARRLIETQSLSAKYLLYSKFFPAGAPLELFGAMDDRIRILRKYSPKDEIAKAFEWLLLPLSPPASRSDLHELIEVVNVPWQRVKEHLAANPRHLHTMDPRKFEALIAELYREHGWEVELTRTTRDGGYDIIALSPHKVTRQKILIEAKRWHPGHTVGVGVVRSLYSVRTIQAVSQVVLATSSHVSPDAKHEFARVVPWELDFVERDEILNWCRNCPSVQVF